MRSTLTRVYNKIPITAYTSSGKLLHYYFDTPLVTWQCGLMALMETKETFLILLFSNLTFF